jgi:hypothetical protein
MRSVYVRGVSLRIRNQHELNRLPLQPHPACLRRTAAHVRTSASPTPHGSLLGAAPAHSAAPCLLASSPSHPPCCPRQARRRGLYNTVGGAEAPFEVDGACSAGARRPCMGCPILAPLVRPVSGVISLRLATRSDACMPFMADPSATQALLECYPSASDRTPHSLSMLDVDRGYH